VTNGAGWHRKVRWFFALQDAIDISGCAPVLLHNVVLAHGNCLLFRMFERMGGLDVCNEVAGR
jgi:hypothetical protein